MNTALHPPAGLCTAEARERLRATGPNEITQAPRTSLLRLFLGQFRSVMIALLAGAALLSALLGDLADAVAIGAIVVLNALVGFVQELRAERALFALRGLTAPRARVRRDGLATVIPAGEVVPGDVLLLEAGDLVAADARLSVAHELGANEAALTGESVPVSKHIGGVPPDAPLAERFDHVFLGTTIATGTGEAEVVATGMNTQLGRIAHLLETAEESETPLQRRLARVGHSLLLMCLGVVVVVAALGAYQGQAFLAIVTSSISLAVAAVPEGLAAVVTVALALGMQRMAAHRALVRRMPAVETLGCTTVICTDKTGTLTTGVMAVREVWGPDHHAVLEAAAACCEAELDASGRAGTGDPTEVALLVAAAERGVQRAVLERERPRVAVTPFDSERKWMSVLRADGVLYVKGAVDVLLPRCDTGPSGALAANDEMAARGLRVLAVATGTGSVPERLRLLGLVGLSDPPRPEAMQAIDQARRAGVRTVMITGDHPVTARAIARELGLLREGDDPAELVHARATAEDKLNIVRRWKARGAVVAMTGDGVNDAPALREAHVGIAMGRTGTEVSREAADIVLTDDNYATLVAAIREGRGIYENIRKALVYLLAGNVAELSVMLLAALAGLPMPLLPLHLLWINLVTDGLPALALVTDPPASDAMAQPPRRTDEPILGRPQWATILWTGALQTAVALAVFRWGLDHRGLDEARNLAFSTLVFGELLRAFAARSATTPLWRVGILSNLRLLAVVLGSIVVQLATHHVPALRAFLHIGELPAADCVLTLALGLIPLATVELGKALRRSGGPRPWRTVEVKA